MATWCIFCHEILALKIGSRRMDHVEQLVHVEKA